MMGSVNEEEDIRVEPYERGLCVPLVFYYSAYQAYTVMKDKEFADLVPVGELEGFVKEVGGHGPSWVNDVLEAYPDLSSEVYDEVAKFIRSMGL